LSADLILTHVVGAVAIIVGMAYLFGMAARRLGQPQIIGQILAGIALGPSVLGHISGHLSTVLFPAVVVPYINIVAQIALVLFLFAIGYELDLRSLRSQRRVVPVVAICAFGIPMLLGGGSVFALGSMYNQHDGVVAHRAAFVLFIAVAMSITAVPVLAAIVRERNIGSSMPAVVSMTAAGVIDAAGWLALTGALLLAEGSGKGHLSMSSTLLLFGGYILVMVFVVRPVLLRWLRRPGALVRHNTPIIVVVAMGSAWATGALGLHIIFGAFMAGLITPRTADGSPDTEFTRPLQEAGNLLLPLFFVVSGLSVNLSGLRGNDYVLLAVILGIAILGKLGGGMLGGRLAGLKNREAGVVGVMLNTRGLTELIALNVGLQAKIIDQRLYTILVVMALVTTILTGLFLTALRFPGPGEEGPRAEAPALLPSIATPN
jgi:Kef-type K+ transport system membrane component KefB